jgi:hypothetical protein
MPPIIASQFRYFVLYQAVAYLAAVALYFVISLCYGLAGWSVPLKVAFAILYSVWAYSAIGTLGYVYKVIRSANEDVSSPLHPKRHI